MLLIFCMASDGIYSGEEVKFKYISMTMDAYYSSVSLILSLKL